MEQWRTFRRDLAAGLNRAAERRRATVADVRAEWFDGLELQGLTKDVAEVSLTLANIQDALADAVRPRH